MNRVLVVGGGAWGCALAVQAGRAGAAAALWARDAARARARLGGAEVRIVGEPEAADLVLLAVPVQHLRAVVAPMRFGAAAVVVCSKGVETETGALPLEVVGGDAVLTGPNFAGEVLAGLPAASVVAGADAALREAVASRLGSARFRLYGNDDPVGAQVGGAAKNVIAIAAGVVIGAGLGENARAALVTRGLSELMACAVALGGRAETVAGLSGLGDLLLTCAGRASRNYGFGLALGGGASVGAALEGAAGVVEGVWTAPALLRRAAGVELPICAAVAALLAGRMTVADAVDALLSRPRRDE